MTPLIIIGTVVVVLAIVLLYRFLKPGYRGAIGFKNRHASEIATLSLTDFPSSWSAARLRGTSTRSIT